MLGVVQTIFFVIFYFILIYLVGMFYGVVCKKANLSTANTLIVGFIFVFSISQIIGVPLILLKQSLTMFMMIFSAVACGIILFTVLKLKGDILLPVKRTLGSLGKHNSLLYIALAAVAIQVAFVVIFYHGDADSAYYTGSITTAMYTNTMFQYDPYTGIQLPALALRYSTASYLMLTAVFAKVLSIHPLILIETALPAVHMIITYIVLWQIGKMLFDDDEKKNLIFILFMIILYLFGSFSVYSGFVFAFTRGGQGKAVLANILVPMMMYLYIKLEYKKDTSFHWMLIFLAAVAGTGFSLSSALVLPVAIVGFELPLIILKKKRFVRIGKILLYMLPCIVMFGLYIASQLTSFRIPIG